MKKTVAIFIFSIFWLHAAAQNGELKNRLDRLEQAIDGAVNLIKDLHKEVESFHDEHNNILQAINRPPLVGSSPLLPQFVPKICPTNIGPGTNCFDNETFGCYCLVGVDLNVTEAARFCQKRAMRLLSIESSAEEQYLTQIIEAANFGTVTVWWTSGSDVEVQNNWVWTATGQPVQYTNWAPGEPNNVGTLEHYIGIQVSGSSIKWFDFPEWNWTFIYAICEY